MPIANVRDAVEVENRLDDILDEDDAERRVGHIRTLFVETLDWQYADGLISLHNARNDNLPSDAHLIASRDGTSAVYIPLTDADTDRITAATVNATARALDDTLAGDLLLLFTNQAGDQFHIIRPDLSQARPRLQRMVVRRWEHHRTVVQQLRQHVGRLRAQRTIRPPSHSQRIQRRTSNRTVLQRVQAHLQKRQGRNQRLHGRARAAPIHADALQSSDVRVFYLA